jgi:uncharacterized membrane protein
MVVASALDQAIRGLALSIEFGGSLLVVAGCVRGLVELARGRGSQISTTRARLLVADSIIAALGFKTAAALLKTVELRTWDAILMFAAIFALRTLVKRVVGSETEC